MPDTGRGGSSPLSDTDARLAGTCQTGIHLLSLSLGGTSREMSAGLGMVMLGGGE